MTLRFDSETDGDRTVVHLHGTVDRDAGPVLDAIGGAADVAAVLELDFAGTDYINSSGIALIVGLLSRARTRHHRIRATGLTPHYVHIFEITRLSDFIEVVAPVEQEQP